MPRKLIIPAEIKVCATCAFWDGERRVDAEIRMVVVQESCKGECLLKQKPRDGLNDVRGESDCDWDHIAPDEPHSAGDDGAGGEGRD